MSRLDPAPAHQVLRKRQCLRVQQSGPPDGRRQPSTRRDSRARRASTQLSIATHRRTVNALESLTGMKRPNPTRLAQSTALTKVVTGLNSFSLQPAAHDSQRSHDGRETHEKLPTRGSHEVRREPSSNY